MRDLLKLPKGRRLFVGDLHGCIREFEGLLAAFEFRPGHDQLISLGDILGKGPNALACLQLCQSLGALVVRGNHDAYLLQAAETPEAERNGHHRQYLASLGPDANLWLDYVRSWPHWIEYPDLFAVHAGFVPGFQHPDQMPLRMLLKIRTWDGHGIHLWRKTDPPWFSCDSWEKPVVFGHWAERGLVDLPRFHGIDTGCVYGRQLTGWCPEENRYLHFRAHQVYQSLD